MAKAQRIQMRPVMPVTSQAAVDVADVECRRMLFVVSMTNINQCRHFHMIVYPVSSLRCTVTKSDAG